MRTLTIVLIACTALAPGCAGYIAGSGLDLCKLTTQAQVHEKFGSPIASGPSFEEFTTRRKIAEPWNGEGIAMLEFALTL